MLFQVRSADDSADDGGEDDDDVFPVPLVLSEERLSQRDGETWLVSGPPTDAGQ